VKRVIAHWSVTKYKADTTSRQHYHFIVEGDGTVVDGLYKPEANERIVGTRYAAHTRGCNTGSIGVACAAMLGAISVDKPGDYPITSTQFTAMCRLIAKLCKKYDIPVTPQTVLSHAEVQDTLGIKQNGKWDISVLPFAGFKTAKACGDEMRRRVALYVGEPK
jgi:N-acetyl-anhydromuramyl-L-alanine amidase AmpD